MTDPDDLTVRRSSLAAEAYGVIRNMVVEGEIPPGSRVTVRPIADQLGLSSTPIKAALAALEREGVLISELHRGYFVPRLGLDDMLEIYEMRELLDGIASRRAATAPQRAQIAETLRFDRDEQQESLRRGDLDGYRRRDLDFHRNLWVLCGNHRVPRAGEGLLSQMKLGNAFMARLPGRMPESLSEHRRIIEAIADGDPQGAERAAREHIASVRGSFMEWYQDGESAEVGDPNS